MTSICNFAAKSMSQLKVLFVHLNFQILGDSQDVRKVFYLTGLQSSHYSVTSFTNKSPLLYLSLTGSNFITIYELSLPTSHERSNINDLIAGPFYARDDEEA